MELERKIRIILDEICWQFGVSENMIKGQSRHRYLCEPRQLAMHFIHKYTSISVAKSSKRLNRHHTTLVYTNKMIDNLLITNRAYRNKYEKIDTLIKNKING